MNFKCLFTLFLLGILISSTGINAQPMSKKEKEEQKQPELASYLEEYRILTLDFKKDDLYNYYLDVFLRVAKEKKTFKKDLKVALRYFKQAPNLKEKDHLIISKTVFNSEETMAQSKERISDLFDAFTIVSPNFSQMMSEQIFTHLEKLELDKIRYFSNKGILEKTVRDRKDNNLLKLYCRILISRGQFKSCYDLLTRSRDVIKPQTFQNLQIESLLYEGDIKLAKTLLESSDADFECKKEVKKSHELMMRRYVAIYHRMAGEFKKSLDCLTPLEKNKETSFFYFYDGMKAARLLDKNTTDYLFKKAVQVANRRASKYLNTLLDWEEVKNNYSKEKLNTREVNEVMSTMEVQGFRPILVAADNLKQNMLHRGDELQKHQSLKYLELLDIYWMVTLKNIEKNRRKKKK